MLIKKKKRHRPILKINANLIVVKKKKAKISQTSCRLQFN